MTRRLAVYADGPDGPLIDPVLAGATEAVLGWVVRTPDWLPSPVPCSTLVVGAGLRRPVGDGTVRFVPTRLSAIPGLIAGRLRPDVAVVGACSTPGGGWRLVGSPGYAAAAVAAAGSVVIERWPTSSAPPLGSPLPADARIAAVHDRVDPPDAPPANNITDAHRVIGRLVAGLIPEGATVQWGPGAIGASVVASLDRPVSVRSGLVTDELVDLDRRGLLAGPAAAAYVWGGHELSAMASDGRLDLRPVSWTHDLTALSAVPRFVAINTALQVGLDGAANVEVVGGRVVTGPGGHPDFAAGAARSPGGLSIVALPATAGGRSSIGGRSTIVRTPEVVSTPRCDVDVVVTEHGVADLRGLSPSERAAAVISVAAPDFRASLG